ncbi:MAG: dihydrolipoyl dehydrogenase [Thiohalomonadales bacterium]
MTKYEVLVIGAGPGGYVAAIRAAQLGYKVACIDAWKKTNGDYVLGGTCLNVGCIPSKALLDSSHKYHELCHKYDQHGISAQQVNIDIKKMLARKDKVVNTLTGGIATLFTKHNIDWIKGEAHFVSQYIVSVSNTENSKKKTQITADYIIIATGSTPVIPEGIKLDGKTIVDSSDALSFKETPETLCVLGGGVIGLELGSVWNRLGAKTSVLIRGDKFLDAVDQQLAKLMHKELQQQGLQIRLATKVIECSVGKKGVKLSLKDADGEHVEYFDKLLVAVGRKPNSSGLNGDKIGLKINEKGFIEVDEYCRTNVDHIYAIGDVVRGPMLAHKASEEGSAVAEIIAGQYNEIDLNTIPKVIYTWPELAWVGMNTEQLDAVGKSYKVGSYPFFGNGRAQAQGDITGLVKILSDEYSDEILGAHIMGPGASEMIAEMVVAMEFKASAEDIARTVHAHPSLSEAIHEAALAVDKRAIHI